MSLHIKVFSLYYFEGSFQPFNKKIIILFFIPFLFFFSCKPTPKDRTFEREARQSEFKNIYSEAYFKDLQDFLELDDITMKSIKGYNSKFKYHIRHLNLKGELTPEKRKQLRQARNKLEKEELGVKKYKEKLEFDKNWLAK